MMGLPNYLHWLAWFTKSFVFFVVSVIAMTILMKARILTRDINKVAFVMNC